MRKLLLAALAVALSGATAVSGADAAGYSDADAAGTWVCAGNGYALTKHQHGAPGWVPSSFAGWYTLQNGQFAAVQETDNTNGTACHNTLGKGPNSYSVSSDGMVSFTLTESPAGSSSAQCPVNSTAHATGVFQSANRIEAVLTDSGASGWFSCTKR